MECIQNYLGLIVFRNINYSRDNKLSVNSWVKDTFYHPERVFRLTSRHTAYRKHRHGNKVKKYIYNVSSCKAKTFFSLHCLSFD